MSVGAVVEEFDVSQPRRRAAQDAHGLQSSISLQRSQALSLSLSLSLACLFVGVILEGKKKTPFKLSLVERFRKASIFFTAHSRRGASLPQKARVFLPSSPRADRARGAVVGRVEVRGQPPIVGRVPVVGRVDREEGHIFHRRYRWFADLLDKKTRFFRFLFASSSNPLRERARSGGVTPLPKTHRNDRGE